MLLTLFGAGAVSFMLLSYALEDRAATWVLVFALACAASALYGWLAGTWPFGVVEGRLGTRRRPPLVAAEARL